MFLLFRRDQPVFVDMCTCIVCALVDQAVFIRQYFCMGVLVGSCKRLSIQILFHQLGQHLFRAGGSQCQNTPPSLPSSKHSMLWCQCPCFQALHSCEVFTQNALICAHFVVCFALVFLRCRCADPLGPHSRILRCCGAQRSPLAARTGGGSRRAGSCGGHVSPPARGALLVFLLFRRDQPVFVDLVLVVLVVVVVEGAPSSASSSR